MRVFFTLLSLTTLLIAQPDSKQKIANIRSLAKQGGSGAIGSLAGYVHDTDPDVRREATRAIVTAGTQASLDPLVEACRDSDEDVQVRAVDGLVNFYLPGYVPKDGMMTSGVKRLGRGIKSRFTDTNDQVIDGHIEVRGDVADAVRHVMANGATVDAKSVAARAAGVLRARTASPELLNAVKSKDTQLIYESLIAIQKIRDPENAPGITFLLQDLNERVQIPAIETTGLLRNKAALPALREAMTRARNNRIRAAALAAIAMMPDETNRELYDKHLGDRDESIRASAAEGYARLENPADRDRLEQAFERESRMKPRLSMAFAAVSLGRRDLTEFSPLQYLINTLNSSSYHQVAAAFLKELSLDREIRESLHGAIGQRTKAEKIDLAGVLAYTADPSSIPVLETLSRDPDPEVGQAATRALRSVRSRTP